jgi:hypothetical protein
MEYCTSNKTSEPKVFLTGSSMTLFSVPHLPSAAEQGEAIENGEATGWKKWGSE